MIGYKEGNFEPKECLEITLINTLDFGLKDCPVVITREEFPVKKLHEMWITIVDPSLPPHPEPTKEVLAFVGGYGIRKEINGHQIFYHLILWWESANIDWKLWFPTSIDMYGERKQILMSEEICIHNYCGSYDVPKVNWDYGSDIMSVCDSICASAIGLFEFIDKHDSVSLPRFTFIVGENFSKKNLMKTNLQILVIRLVFIMNGPILSIYRVRTMKWNTGNGYYELVQDYTAYSNQNYSIYKVTYTKFLPYNKVVSFACGIKANKNESGNIVEKDIAICIGSELVADPNDYTGQIAYKVDFIESALEAKDKYKPFYQCIKSFGKNHTFRIPITNDLSFEYLIAGAWGEGIVYNTPDLFIEYMRETAVEYNNPIKVTFGKLEVKKDNNKLN